MNGVSEITLPAVIRSDPQLTACASEALSEALSTLDRKITLKFKELTPKECTEKAIEEAANIFVYRNNELSKIWINWNSSLENEEKQFFIIFELCNAFFAQFHVNLNQKAKLGTITQEEFSLGHEDFEWKALDKCAELMKKHGLEKLAKRIPQAYLDDFADYYKKQIALGHTEHYNKVYRNFKKNLQDNQVLNHKALIAQQKYERAVAQGTVIEDEPEPIKIRRRTSFHLIRRSSEFD